MCNYLRCKVFKRAVGLVSFEHVDWNNFPRSMTSVKYDHELAPLSRDLVLFGLYQ
jgi:hypothetical protein